MILLGLLLDAALGEPKWLWSRAPHPAVLFGRLIGMLDHRFNKGRSRRLRGATVMALLVLGSGLLGWAISRTFGPIGEIATLAILLAQRSLSDHVWAVAKALGESTEAGKHAVSMIVGRDTRDMTEPEIARAAIESAAENLSDGVIAPAFWFLVGGLPGLMIYKITNTADSMIGYRTERHEAFGWAAARFDDLLNLAPARLTALLLWLPRRQGGLRAIRTDAALHRSPNAGWPEAAMARHLSIALSGPRSYDGRQQEFPWVNSTGRKDATARDIRAAVKALWAAWAIFTAGAALTLL